MSDNSIENENQPKDASQCEISKECSKDSKINNSLKKQKRPDKQLYIPPGSKNAQTSEPESSKPDKLGSPTQENEPSWDSLYDDNGEVLDDEFVSDLNCELELKVNSLSNQLASAKLDYSKFSPVVNFDCDNAEFGNVLEIYDFPPDLKTRDLVTNLSATHTKNFDIEWVDDTHALIIFATPLAASEALGRIYPNLKLRPVSQGIRESQLKAKKKLETKAPRKPRPETTTLLARRLVAGALGIKADINPEQKRAEREKLRLAKEKKQQTQKQVKNIWEGNPDDVS